MLRNIEITRLLRYNRANMKELFEAEVWLRQMARLRNFVRKNSPRVLELCCFEWFQNIHERNPNTGIVLELCCFEWFQNFPLVRFSKSVVLELCCFEWFQNLS